MTDEWILYSNIIFILSAWKSQASQKQTDHVDQEAV